MRVDRTERSDRYLDARGLHCPEPVFRVRRALLSMRAGEWLDVLADDPLAEVDLRVFCQRFGHLLSGPEPEQDAQRFRIRVGPSPQTESG